LNIGVFEYSPSNHNKIRCPKNRDFEKKSTIRL
jgi:hypothetical protein